MRIVGWPEESDEEGAILPVTLADVDFQGTPEELRAIGEFLLKSAVDLGIAQAENLPLNQSLGLGNSNPNAEVGLFVSVVRHVVE